MLTIDIIIASVFAIAYIYRPMAIVGDGILIPVILFFSGWASAAIVGYMGLPILAVVMFVTAVINLGLTMWSSYQSAR